MWELAPCIPDDSHYRRTAKSLACGEMWDSKAWETWAATRNVAVAAAAVVAVADGAGGVRRSEIGGPAERCNKGHFDPDLTWQMDHGAVDYAWDDNANPNCPVGAGGLSAHEWEHSLHSIDL